MHYFSPILFNFFQIIKINLKTLFLIVNTLKSHLIKSWKEIKEGRI
jgi:hypothetical protein